MSDPILQPVSEPISQPGPGLSQIQRVIYTFTAPSKTFSDIKAGHKSWWLPFLITILFGAIFYGAITQKVTWNTVYENQQRLAPQFAKDMMDRMPPEQRAKADAAGPKNQAITWALSPIGLLMIDLVAALFLWPTINFGFGGKATYGSILAVEIFSGLVLWPIRFVLGSIICFVETAPEGFNIGNPAPTNIAAFLDQSATPHALYSLAMSLDVLTIWCLIITSIGVATVAGVKRSSGYVAVFGWWALIVIAGVGFAAMF